MIFGKTVCLVNRMLQLCGPPTTVTNIAGHVLGDGGSPNAVLGFYVRNFLKMHRAAMLCLTLIQLGKLGRVPCQLQAVLVESCFSGMFVQLAQRSIHSCKSTDTFVLDNYSRDMFAPNVSVTWPEVWILDRQDLHEFAVIVPQGGYCTIMFRAIVWQWKIEI